MLLDYYGKLDKASERVQMIEIGKSVLGKPLLRAGTSVGANYREANRARLKAEFIAKIGDCLKEADESGYWLELLLEEAFLPQAKLQPLIDEADELVAIFVTISKRARGD